MSKDNTFSEDDIRPEHLNDEKEAAYRRDVERLLRNHNKFVAVSCPACNVKEGTEKWQKWQLSYVECSNCKTVYVSPRPTSELLEEYYSTSEVYEFWAKYIFPASESVRRERIFRPRVQCLIDICDRYAFEPSTLVEIGPGFGTFCEEAKASGYFKEILAIEPTPSLAQNCRERGIDVIESLVEQVNFEGLEASVVASFEVLEHLFDPRSFLQACYSITQPGGLIVLTCPNVQGFEVEVLGSVADTVDTEHLNYFHPQSLSFLLESTGFEVLEVSTPGVLDADIVRNKVLANKFELSHHKFLQTVLIENWSTLGKPFQDFLKLNNRSSHMWIVGRKQFPNH